MLRIAVVLVLSAAAPAAAGCAELALEIRVTPDPVAFGEAVSIETQIVNRGESPVTYFEPDHAEVDGFPPVRFVRVDDGRVFAPWIPPYQTMVSEGLAGTIVRLAPGEHRSVTVSRHRFVPAAKGDGPAEPASLPPGEYAVEAEYVKADDLVPWNTGGFDVEMRRHEGLFTGRAAAVPIRFRVAPPDRPYFALLQPDRALPRLILAIVNPTDAPLTIDGVGTLEIHSKMYGHLSARLPVAPPTVAPGSRGEFAIDLRRLGFQPGNGSRLLRLGLNELILSGPAWMTLRVDAADGREIAAPEGILGEVPPPPDAGLADLALTLRGDRPEDLAISLENRADGPRRVNARLAFPADLIVVVRRVGDDVPPRGSMRQTAPTSLDDLRPRGWEGSRLAAGLAWDGDRFEAAPPLTLDHLRVLRPGESVARTFDLPAHLADGLPPGRYAVRAGLANAETGLRFGLAEDDTAATGTLWSPELELTVTAR